MSESGRIADKLQIDMRSNAPIWLQLRNRLIFLISSGYCRPGDRLPTVRELAIDLKINYNTVNKVYQSLIHDGYIVSMRGRGTFVEDVSRPRADYEDSPADSVIDIMIDRCLEIGVPLEDIADQVGRRVARRAGTSVSATPAAPAVPAGREDAPSGVGDAREGNPDDGEWQ